MSLFPGQFVDSWRAPDANLQIRCPACQHWTANIPIAAIKPERATGQSAWLDCACVEHNGQGEHGPVLECQCKARFRLKRADTSGRFAVAGVDYTTMATRIQAREAQEVEA